MVFGCLLKALWMREGTKYTADSGMLQCFIVKKKKCNYSDCFYYSVVISVKVVLDGVEGGGDEKQSQLQEGSDGAPLWIGRPG